MIDKTESGDQIVLIEVTIPWDSIESIEAAQKRKKERYADLVREISAEHRIELITLEVGTRGFISTDNKQKLISLCRKWKIKKMSAVLATTARLALIGSRSIWNGRNSPTWGTISDP